MPQIEGRVIMGKTIAYLRVSTDQQDLNNQKHEIESYAKKRNIQIDEWVEVEISSLKKKARQAHRRANSGFEEGR